MIAILLLLVAQQRPVDDLIAAERAFARTSLEKTTQEAFLGVFSHDAVLFRPGPVPAIALLRERPFAPELWLKWAPMLARVSESGELGYTSGPFESGRRREPPRGKGYFVSIWRKEPGGDWKLVVDLGISSPAAIPVDSAAAVLARSLATETSSAGGAKALDELVAADQRFAQLAASRGTSHAFDQLLSADARVYREGSEPAVGKGSALSLLSTTPAVTWKSEQARIARSGDLGYTIGSYESAERGSYVRLWRRTPAGWKIVLDITSATPPPGSPE